MSPYEYYNMEISRIQFHTELDQKTKNKMIAAIEEKLYEMEQKELDGESTGFYQQ